MRGGYQKPSNPAPVSGPGAMSKRTDGGPAQAARYMSGGDYGDGGLMDIQTAAPMSASGVDATAAAVPTQSMPLPRGLAEDDDMPDIPVTDGAALGAGRGVEALGFAEQDAAIDAASREAIATAMPALLFIAGRPETSTETRDMIRQLRSLL